MSFRANNATKFARSSPMIECAQCGEQLFMPEWSEYIDERRARHLWECDTCGYAFESTVFFAASGAEFVEA